MVDIQTLTGQDAPYTSSTILLGTPAVVAQLRKVFDTINPELLQ